MTEKRFTLDNEENGLCKCILMNGEEIPICEVVELLNELYEENKKLQRHLDVMRSGALTDDKRIKELYDENEQLKQSYKEFEDECQSTFNAMNRKQNDLYRKNFKLKEENEQLKQQKDKWKQQCIHFKEMLDDMDIAYLCDEWIYEEMKGDME